jgi:hypothetical protein
MGWKSLLTQLAEGGLTTLAIAGPPGVSIAAGIGKAALEKNVNIPATPLPADGPDVFARIDAIVAGVEGFAKDLKDAGGTMTPEQKKAVAVTHAFTVFTESFALAGRKVGDEAALKLAMDQAAQAASLAVEARLNFLKSIKVEG